MRRADRLSIGAIVLITLSYLGGKYEWTTFSGLVVGVITGIAIYLECKGDNHD